MNTSINKPIFTSKYDINNCIMEMNWDVNYIPIQFHNLLRDLMKQSEYLVSFCIYITVYLYNDICN